MSLAPLLAACRSAVERHLLLHRIYARVFRSGDGPLVMQDLIRQFGGLRSSVVFGQPDATAYHEGQRSVVLYLRKKVRLSQAEVDALEVGEGLGGPRDPLAIGDDE